VKIAKQQAALQIESQPILEDRDASVIQKIGIYFRGKQEYERACDLLERVLEIKKNIKLQEENKNPKSSVASSLGAP
tara:strand:+ start:429 stop:659 length:231 start_codon:yes stop_codon:yes gene_type:complete